MGHKAARAYEAAQPLDAMPPLAAGPHVPPAEPDAVAAAELDAVAAAAVAQTMQALAAPSRLLILSRLRREPCSVTRLAADIGMEQSAVSHQLRLLRHLGLVEGTRHGKTMVYALYDDHVARLLDEAVYHSEHLRLGLRDHGSALPALASLDDPIPAATATN